MTGPRLEPTFNSGDATCPYLAGSVYRTRDFSTHPEAQK